MPRLRDYHILISHSWDYNSDYEMLKDWFDKGQGQRHLVE